MVQGMRVTVDAAMRARDVSRIRPHDEAPPPSDEAEDQRPTAPNGRSSRAEKRRLAKRRAPRT
jgi:hypothetical protein